MGAGIRPMRGFQQERSSIDIGLWPWGAMGSYWCEAVVEAGHSSQPSLWYKGLGFGGCACACIGKAC